MKRVGICRWSAVTSVVLFSVGVLINTSCGKSDSTKTQAAPAPPVQVVVASVQQKTVPIYSEFVGQTKAYETVYLRARIEGVWHKRQIRPYKEPVPQRRRGGRLTISRPTPVG